MVKRLILHGTVLVGICGMAMVEASVPSVDELLDRFAATIDRRWASYACTEEGTKVRVIRKALSPRFRLGEHKMHYWVESRWDGQRFIRRDLSWGDNVQEPSPRSTSKEKALYRIMLFDLDRTIQYSVSLGGKPESGLVGYKGRPPDKSPLDSAGNNIAFAPRIDLELRGCRNAKVRPQTESINGVDCYVLEGHMPDARHTVWIDPIHGYNVAKYIRETKTSRSVMSTLAFKQIDDNWVPIEKVYEMRLFMPPAPIDDYSREHVKVTEFKIDPDHEALKSFEVDEEIPNGTRVFWALPNRRVVTEGYIWKDGKPAPEVDEEIVAQLDSIAATLTQRNSMPGTDGEEGPPMEVAEILAGYGSEQERIRSLITTEETTFPRQAGTASQKCELRSDGVRVRYRSLHGTTRVPYRIFLWDGTNLIQYRGASRESAGGLVQITANVAERDALLAREYKGAPLMGFFWPDYPHRIDAILASARQLSLERNVRTLVGVPCDVVKGVTDKGSYKVWFDPARDYHIVRAEVRRPGGSSEPSQAGPILFLMENIRFKDMGQWIPMEADIKRFSRDNGSVTRYHQRRRTVRLRPNHKSLGSFKASGIPNETKVVATDAAGRQRHGIWRNGSPVMEVKK